MSLPATDPGWLELQLETLFAHDGRGRLHGTREAGAPVAPRFFFGSTRSGNLWRFRQDLPAETVVHLARLAGKEPPSLDPSRPPERAEAFREVLLRQAPIPAEWWGPAFRFPDPVPYPPDPAPRRVTEKDLLVQDFPALAPRLAEIQPCFGVLLGERLVSVCYSARRGPRAAEAGVDTLEGFRRRGFAVQTTAAWAHALRSEGLAPLFSTSWGNRASLGVARRLGLEVFASDLHFQ